eukprot:tig00020660_g12507.t1
MLPAVEDLARRGDADGTLMEICLAVLEAVSNESSLCQAAELADVATLVHTGDPKLCRSLVNELIGKAKKQALTERGALAVLATAVGHLPPGTLSAADWNIVLDFCSKQVESLSGKDRSMWPGPDNEDAQLALELTASVLAAYEAASGADGAASPGGGVPSAPSDPGPATEPDGEGSAPDAGGGVAAPVPSDLEGRMRMGNERVQKMGKQLEELERRAKEGQWWRAEASAMLAGQALASAGASGARFGDAVRRCKAAVRIVGRLYKAGKIIAEGVSSMGATTVIDLVIWAKEALTDEKGGVLQNLRELWDDVRTVAGKGPQGQGAWYPQARLLGSLAAGGHLAELDELLRDKDGACLDACASSRPLTLTLVNALVRVAEGPDGAQAAAAARWIDRLARRAADLGREGEAAVAIRALEHVELLEDACGRLVAPEGTELLQRLRAYAGGRLQPTVEKAVGCLAVFARGARRAADGGIAVVKEAADIATEMGGEGAGRFLVEAASAVKRTVDDPRVQLALRVSEAPKQLLSLTAGPATAVAAGPGRSVSPSQPPPPARKVRRMPLRPIPIQARDGKINGYLEGVLKAYKKKVEKALRPVKRVHVYGRNEDVEQVIHILTDLADDLCSKEPFRNIRTCVDPLCPSRAVVLVASRATAREGAFLRALDEAVDAGRVVFQLYLNRAELVLREMPVGVDMRLSRFTQRQLETAAVWDEEFEPLQDRKSPLEAFVNGVQHMCSHPPLTASAAPAAGRHRIQTRWHRGAMGAQLGPQPEVASWVLAEFPPADLDTRVYFCHAPEDAAVVRKQEAFLAEEASSCSSWSAADHLKKGERWVDVVAHAIRNCTHFILVVSSAFNGSQHCREELAYACSRDCALVAMYPRPQESAADWVEQRLRRVPPSRVQSVNAPLDRMSLWMGGRRRPPPPEATALCWSEADVAAWIGSQGPLAQFAERLSFVNGRGLLSITDSALHQLGIDNAAARRLLLSKVANLSESALMVASSDKDEVLCWTEEEVVAWVRSKGPVAQFADLFSFARGSLLLSLSDADLECMGVDNFLARQRLLQEIAKLAARKPAGESSIAIIAALDDNKAKIEDNRALITKFAKALSAELFQDRDLALYVPPLATPDPKLPSDKHVDLHMKAVEFMSALLRGQSGDAKAKKKRVLLLLGVAGTSKSTFLRFLQRDVCARWVAAAEDPSSPRPPVAVLVSLPQLAAAAGGVSEGLRQHVASKLGVAADALPAIRDEFGLVLLLDGYDEMGAAGGVNLWQANRVSDWAGGAVLTCRTEFLASFPMGQRPEASFAPTGEDDKPSEAGLMQLHTVPFTKDQRAKYLGHYVDQHAGERSGWTVGEYEAALASTPGLATFAENPFSLSMLARVLPTKTASGGRLGIRDLYRLFLRDWLLRELHRRGEDWASEEDTDMSICEEAFVAEGMEFCSRFACLLFRRSASQATVPDQRVPRLQKTGAGVNSKPAAAAPSPDERALSDLLGDRKKLFVRNSCPLRRWRQGDKLGFAFTHKTLQEFLSAEALLASLLRTADAADLIGIDWSIRSFVEESTLVRFLAEAVQHEPQAPSRSADALVQIVLRSRVAPGKAISYADGAPEVIAAANAATVLVASHTSLSGLDLRGVRIPKANLWRLEAAGADLREADLRHCDMHEACLSGANLSGARLDNCRVVQQPALLHKDVVTAVAWTPDGKRIVSGSCDKLVRVWDAESGELLLPLEGHEGQVTSVAVSADGKRIVSGSSDETVRVWDAESGAELLLLEGHTDEVTSVALSAGP